MNEERKSIATEKMTRKKEVFRMPYDTKERKFGEVGKSSIVDYETDIKDRKTSTALPVSDELFKKFKKVFGEDVRIVF